MRPCRPIVSLALLALLPQLSLSVPANAASVLTQHNDNARTGANPDETRLTPLSVNAARFGKLFTLHLDANVNGQVLYVPDVTINGGVHNVVYIYTSSDNDGSPCSVYAFDADDPDAAAKPLWRKPFTPGGAWTSAAPAIDPATKTIYVLTKHRNNSGLTQLHALDITTGFEKPGSPVTVEGSVPGKGDGSSGGTLAFDTTQHNCRPGLLLLGDTVYAAFAHNTDSFPYHGWIFGYKYDQAKFTQTAIFCTSPDGGDGGIWQSDQGLAADSHNNIYCATGNGTFNINTGGKSYGMCFMKLSTPDLKVLDYFTTYGEKQLSDDDHDVGNCGPLLIPGTNRLFGGATKYGAAYLMDSSNMGGFTPGGPDKVLQTIPDLTGNDIAGQIPVAWDAGATKYVYLWAPGSPLQMFKYDTALGKLNPAGPAMRSNDMAGGSLTVTANGNLGGILWAVGYDGTIHAYDATNVKKEYWNSRQNPERDELGSVGHFQFPTAVNGKLYVPTGSSTVEVYGLMTRARKHASQ